MGCGPRKCPSKLVCAHQFPPLNLHCSYCLRCLVASLVWSKMISLRITGFRAHTSVKNEFAWLKLVKQLLHFCTEKWPVDESLTDREDGLVDCTDVCPVSLPISSPPPMVSQGSLCNFSFPHPGPNSHLRRPAEQESVEIDGQGFCKDVCVHTDVTRVASVNVAPGTTIPFSGTCVYGQCKLKKSMASA